MSITFSYDILCILQTQVETTGGYNTSTHQMTPLLPKMIHSTLKASEKLQPASYNPVLTSLSRYFTRMQGLRNPRDTIFLSVGRRKKIPYKMYENV